MLETRTLSASNPGYTPARKRANQVYYRRHAERLKADERRRYWNKKLEGASNETHPCVRQAVHPVDPV